MPALVCCSAPRRRSAWLSSSILASLLVPAMSTSVLAQQPTTLPPLVVTSPTTVATPVEQIASSVTVITAADIAREQRRTVPDVLSTVPGLNVVQAGGPGAQTSIFMRGTNPNHVKVLIDGIDVSDPSNPARSFELGHLLTDNIERIEVLRGPQSGLYGADALGGVISITTRKGEGPARVRGTVEGGSFGTFNQTAGLSGSQDRFNYAFNVVHFRATDTPVTPAALLPPGRASIGDLYDNVTASTRLGVDFTDTFGVNMVARYTDSTLRFTSDGGLPSVPNATQSTQIVHQLFTRGEAVWSLLDGRFKNYFGVNYTDHWNWTQAPDSSTPTITKGERIKYDWRGVASLLPGQALVMGAEYDNERLDNATIIADNGNRGAYLELQSEFAKRFFVVSNVRFDDNDRFGGRTTYRIAPALILPGIETKLKATYGTGFKAPTLHQLFVSFPDFNFFANPNLLPEESFGWDAGLEQPFFGDRVRVGATYFHNDIRNLIAANETFTTNINIGRAETWGVEAFAAVVLTERLRMRADYTFTRAIDATTGLELLRRPTHKASATVAWNPVDPLQVSATVVHVGEWIDGNRDFSIPRLTAPGYTVVNLAADYLVNDNVKLFGRIDNLFDVRYENPTGFERPGLGIFGGIKLANRDVR